jgi:hypothetical protein
MLRTGEYGGACNMHGDGKKCKHSLLVKPEGQDHSGENIWNDGK